jgi:hypothetical protein
MPKLSSESASIRTMKKAFKKRKPTTKYSSVSIYFCLFFALTFAFSLFYGAEIRHAIARSSITINDMVNRTSDTLWSTKTQHSLPTDDDDETAQNDEDEDDDRRQFFVSDE